MAAVSPVARTDDAHVLTMLRNWSASSFLTAYIGIPIYLAIYFGHRIYARTDPWAHPAEVVDLQTGLAEVLAEEKPPKPKSNKWWGFVTKIWS